MAAPTIVLMQFDKETQRTRRYQEVTAPDLAPKIGTLYVPKTTLAELGDPAASQISVTIALA